MAVATAAAPSSSSGSCRSGSSASRITQIVSTRVAEKHPKAATIERPIAARGGRIYVDFMQNGLGKTLASVYSPRANAFAGVSTPLTWEEVAAGVTPQDFTIVNFPARLKAAGDLWAALRKSKGVDLGVLTTKAAKPRTAKSTNKAVRAAAKAGSRSRGAAATRRRKNPRDK